MVFDNAKVRALVPDFRPTIPFERGVREIVDWHLADPARQTVEAALDKVMDDLVLTHRVAV
jgi:hypothetical protein